MRRIEKAGAEDFARRPKMTCGEASEQEAQKILVRDGLGASHNEECPKIPARLDGKQMVNRPIIPQSLFGEQVKNV